MYLVLSNDDFRWKSFCKISSRFLINSLRMLLYCEHSHKTCSTDSHSNTHKKASFTTVSSATCIPSSSFRPWVPCLNLNQGLNKRKDTIEKLNLDHKGYKRRTSLTIYAEPIKRRNTNVTQHWRVQWLIKN